MILEIGKCGSVTRVFRTFPRGSTVIRRNHFVQSARYFLIGEKISPVLQFPWSLERTKALNLKPFWVTECFYSSEDSEGTLDRLSFETICAETLDSLSEYFEELIESVPELKNADVTYSDGVLTVHLGTYGTYVINRQTPNLQIWLSSPTSGPKRYDFVAGTWIYKHDKTTLHSLLDKEISEIVNQQVQFVKKCLHAKASV